VRYLRRLQRHARPESAERIGNLIDGCRLLLRARQPWTDPIGQFFQPFPGPVTTASRVTYARHLSHEMRVWCRLRGLIGSNSSCCESKCRN
jgi:hypothetical protein